MMPLRSNRIRTEQLLFPSTGGKFGDHARGTKPHRGWDLAAQPGTPVYAIESGTISRQEYVNGYGNVIQLEFFFHQRKYWALYAHLSRAFVRPADKVGGGHQIGATGQSGNAMGGPPHLHFAIATSANLKSGQTDFVDPALILGNFLKHHEAGAARVRTISAGGFTLLQLDEMLGAPEALVHDRVPLGIARPWR
jgi:murein DD-endopeptidase MepM/ murein hydrolase activator NlpD